MIPLSNFDYQYKELITDILDNGIWDKDQNVRTRWADGTPAYTKSIISKQLIFDNKEVPILTTKKVLWKTSIKELLWIWQHRDNNVNNLNRMGVHIWDEWKKEDGTIGKAYGYQLGKKSRIRLGVNTVMGSAHPYYEKLDQVEYLIWQLKMNPSSRRHVTSLWNVDDLDEMALNPCVWNTQWLVKKGELHLIVGVRSSDTALGLPFNVFQYYVLQRMIAQVTGYKIGTLTFNLNDAHIYERHIEALQQQINLDPHPTPDLWINPGVKDFFSFTIDDFKLIDYQHHPQLKMEVAI